MTVKRNGDRVILKNGRVACSCCGPCCMYPPLDLFDGKYSHEDLPDTLLLPQTGVLSNFVKYSTPRSRLNEGYLPGFAYYLDQFDQEIVIANERPDEWLYGIRDVNYDGDFGGCLLAPFEISEGVFEPLQWRQLQDEFASTYGISGPIGGTVTRTSICTWQGVGITLSNFSFQWKVNGNAKSGNQNTPVGSYAGGFTVS